MVSFRARAKSLVAVLCLVFCVHGEAGPVLSDNDANIDDIFGYLLLAFSSNPLLGIIVTDADCMGYQTIDMTVPKIQTFANATQIPFAMSSARGKNPFPWFYRSFSASMGELNCLANITAKVNSHINGDALYERILRTQLNSGERITIVATGPLTALANLLRAHPELEDSIEGLIWEAGAVGNADGNIDPNAVYNFVAGSKAEWNVFWDPDAVDYIFRNTSFPITLLPVNLTNDVPVTDDFMHGLDKQSQAGYAMSTLAFEAYSLVSNLTSMDSYRKRGVRDATSYYLWDITAAVYQLNPSFFATPKNMTLSVEIHGNSQGTLYDDPRGRDVQVVLSFNGKSGLAAFYAYFLKALRR